MAKNKLTPYDQYATDVISGKKLACKWEILACERYFNDLKNQKEFYFDAFQAQIRIDFIQRLSFSKMEWAGKPFLLEPWEQFIIANIFGWRKIKDDSRRFEDVTINIPRKNGKTELAAAIALAVAGVDPIVNGEIYMAATSSDQASICLRAAQNMVKLSSFAQRRFEVTAYRVVTKGTGTFIRAVSSEGGKSDGKGAKCVILDEEHEQQTNEQRQSLKTGMASTFNPLFVSISTSGTNRNYPYYTHISICKKILEGVNTDENHFIIIYTIDEGDDWNDSKIWSKANPNYNISIKPNFIKKQHNETLLEPSTQPNFLTKHLNIWTDAHTTWIDHTIWIAGKREIKLSEYYGRECWCGLDLASSMDFTALAIMIPDGENMNLFYKFWIPEQMADKRAKRDQLNFREWARQGYITLTDGNVTDYDVVQRDIVELSKNFNIKKIGYDDRNASQLITNLQNENVTMEVYSQNITSMSPTIKIFERSVHDFKVFHDGNPVMSWMVGNALLVRDGNDNKRIDRGKSTDKVDGVLATMDAVGVYNRDMANEEQYFVG